MLEILSRPSVRCVFAYQTENISQPITAQYVAKKCDISHEEAVEALELLTDIHINHSTDIMLDEDASVRMYSLNSDEYLMYTLMVCKIARMMDEHKQDYFNYKGSYNNLWLQE